MFSYCMVREVDTQFDSEGFLKQYDRLYEDIYKAYQLGDYFDLDGFERPECIAIMGMGGSAISGEFFKAYFAHLKSPIQIRILKSYDLPSDLPEKTLYVAISDSGNTEETLSMYKLAIKKTKQIIALSEAGSKLEQVAKLYRLPFLAIPGGYQPRTAALSYLFFPILRFFERLGLLSGQVQEVEAVRKEVRKKEIRNHAQDISEKLVDVIPIIYASHKYYSVAYRMKTEINENAKVHAFSHEYSEMNHNELLGYVDLRAKYHIVTFQFDDDHRRIKKRMELVKEITNAQGVATTEIKLSGDHFLAKFFSGIVLGDLIAYYLALRYTRDPGPVELIEDFKEKLGPYI